MKRVICFLLALVLAAGHLLAQAAPVFAAAGEQTVYFTAPDDWDRVNFYSWDSDGEITSRWPGDAMTWVEGNVYSCKLPADAVNIIFNNGSAQTKDLKIPSGKDWYDYSQEAWGVYGVQCEHPGHDLTGDCTVCGEYLGHSYEEGFCTGCGVAAPQPGDYYLFGYINGEDYAYGEDEENLGEYRFVDGKLTASFTRDSYVAVKDAANWYMFRSYCKNTTGTLYNTSTGVNEKMFVPGGVTLHFTLVENADGSLTLSYTEGGKPEVQKQTLYFTAPEGWSGVNFYSWDSDGEITSGWPGDAMTPVEGNVYSCQLPVDAVNIIFNNGSDQTKDLKIPSGKDWYDYSTEVWGIYGKQCSHPGHDQDGNCTECGVYLGHSYLDGFCAGCGVAEPVPGDYYLFGFINGADYDALGEYRFVNGRLTATFTQDSYVAVQDGSNRYMFQTYCTDTTGRLYNTSTGVNEKMFVPGGVTLHFVLTENADGSLTLSYSEAGSVVLPNLALSYASVSFEAEICYNLYFTATDLTDVTQMGLLVFHSKKANATYETADQIVSRYATNGSTYMAQTAGVAAKNMGDTLYFRVFAKLTDGTITYSEMQEYSCRAYAKSILANSSNPSMKALVVALLNYGAEAQSYFGYDTDNLMNASLTAVQQALAEPYGADTMPDPVAVDSDKNGIFQNNGFGTTTITASFEGAFAMNYYSTLENTPDGRVMMYYWTEEDYAAADTLGEKNASGSVEMKLTDTANCYWACLDGIAAKEMGKTLFVGIVYTSGGVTHSSRVINYSLGRYCDTVAGKDSSAQQALAQATAVYGYHADAYFQGNSTQPEKPPVSGTYIVGEDELPFSDEEIYQQMFDPNTKLEINLDMSDKELQKLQDDYERYRNMGSKSPIYRLGNLTITMTTEQGTVSYVIKEVGARMKGNTSRTSFYNSSEGIYNYIHFKFDFQETFDDEGYYGSDAKVWGSEEERDARKDRTFATLEKLEMRWNKLYDATYLKESYAYEVYRSEGVLAPQCNIGVLDWSGARMGIYTVEEPVDKVFIERYVSEEDAGGDLYKLGWTNEGATFTNTNSIGVEDEDKGQFFVYDLKTNKKKSNHEDLINLINTLNSGSVTKESFASVVDVDNFLKFAAVSYFMGNPDDLRNNYNNCYVYFLKSSGKAIFIPYDFDRCLGINREWNPNGNSMTKDNPYGEGNQQSPLFRYSVDKGGFYTAEYTQVLLEVAENELLTADAFARRFAIAQSLYADQVTPERDLKNAGGRDFSFDLERTGSASGGSNMSFQDYISAKMTAFRGYMGQSDASSGSYYIRGDFNGWSNDGNYLMKKQGNVLVFTLSFNYSVKFKVYDDTNGTWMGAECVSDQTTATWEADGHTNIVLPAGTYRVSYDPSTKQITIT